MYVFILIITVLKDYQEKLRHLTSLWNLAIHVTENKSVSLYAKKTIHELYNGNGYHKWQK